jgi:branched-chain amino acid transport system ATP-binding protein
MASEYFSVRDLAVSYGAASVLRGVSFEAQPGEIIGLVGPNGAGKTTLLRAISALIPRKAGIVRLEGQVLPQTARSMATAGVAHVPEGRGLIPGLTVRQNIRLATVAVKAPFAAEDLQRIEAVFPAVGRLLDRKAGHLSGGEQQMVAIGRGLAVRPKVLMIDELSLGLAPKIIEDLLAALVRIARENDLAIVLVDQNVRALSRICTRLYALNGRPAALSLVEDHDAVAAAYLGS